MSLNTEVEGLADRLDEFLNGEDHRLICPALIECAGRMLNKQAAGNKAGILEGAGILTKLLWVAVMTPLAEGPTEH